MTASEWFNIAGLAAAVFVGALYLCPDQVRSILVGLRGLFSRRSKGQRLAAKWRKCAARRRLIFSQNILTPDGAVISALPQDRLTLALVEIVSWQSQLRFATCGAIAGYALVSAYTVVMFFAELALRYRPVFLQMFQALGVITQSQAPRIISAAHWCVVAGWLGIALMFLINIRLTLLRGLANAVKKKITMALAARG
jgi:hypothetical protein